MNDMWSVPLEGIKVVDLTTFLSGPFCTQLLADLGASVTKLEPLDGDSSRHIPPYFVGDDSAYFLSVNRTKRSIALDLKDTEGIELARRLISRADVIVENFRPGVANRLGLDRKAILEAHPRLIWASITGFGEDGPWRDRPAYDLIVQALSGVMSLTGEPGSRAVRVGVPIGDLVAGMYAALGIVAALQSRRTTGRGFHVGVSMLDAQLAMLSYQAAYALIGGADPGPQGSRHDSIPTYRTFVAADAREVAVTANTDRMWTDLCRVLGCPELATDPRFEDARRRLEHREELWRVLEALFSRETSSTWVDRLNAAGVPAAAIRSVVEALQDAANRDDDGMLLHLQGTDRDITVAGNPLRQDPPIAVRHTYPPGLGQHTDDVLIAELRLTPEEAADLRRRRVVA